MVRWASGQHLGANGGAEITPLRVKELKESEKGLGSYHVSKTCHQ